MDEVQDFCVRVLGAGERAAHAARTAQRSEGGGDRASALSRAIATCRQAGGTGEPTVESEPGPEVKPPGERGLSEAVADQVARASARLPQRQREALALRDGLGCSYEEIGTAVGIEPAAVAPLLARARLRLRSELRGTDLPPADCPERDRALRTMTSRRDGEQVPAADEDWLIEHLGHCSSCAQSHSATLEASACYRAWRLPEGEPGSATGAQDTPATRR